MKDSQGPAAGSRSEADEARLMITAGGHVSGVSKTLYSELIALDEECSAEDYADALTINDCEEEAVSIYVRLPLHEQFGDVCQDGGGLGHDSRQIDRYLDALCKELELVSRKLSRKPLLQQLHLGGGAPNCLSEIQLARLFDHLDSHFSITDDTEASVDATVYRASLTQLSLLKGFGFQGLNIDLSGVDRPTFDGLGQYQSLAVVGDVVRNARGLGFDTLTVSLRYGAPHHDIAGMASLAARVLALEPDRIYCGSVKTAGDSTGLAAPRASLADRVAMFNQILERFDNAGYNWVGLDCFARPDDVISAAQDKGALRRNWIGYTDKPGRTMLGFGSAARTDLPNLSLQNHYSVNAWQTELEQENLPVSAGKRLSGAQRARRNALSDLMCNMRINDADGLVLGSQAGEQSLESLLEFGVISLSGSTLAVTDEGRLALQQIWATA
ncbi:MAG: coproporphyrinogen III oxidase [Pseudomonadota bacterium]